jgi:hypothetical protein
MRKLTPFCLAFALLGLLTGVGHAQTLYDASLLSTPTDQFWTQLSIPFGYSGTTTAPTAGNPYFTYDTTGGMSPISGFANFAPFSVGEGSSFIFDLQLNSESHNPDNERAGLCVVIVGDDPTKSIEIDFWEDRIFAQDSIPFAGGTTITPGEGVAFDMLSGGTGLGGTNRFLLEFSSATTYSLYANGGTTAILTGNLRDYTGFGTPYDQSDFIYVGDNSSRGESSFRFARFVAAAAAPEPGSGLLLLTVILLPIMAYTQKHRRRPVTQNA